MSHLPSFLRIRLCSQDRGATAVEYGLLLAGIAALGGIAMATFGQAATEVFNHLLPGL